MQPQKKRRTRLEVACAAEQPGVEEATCNTTHRTAVARAPSRAAGHGRSERNENQEEMWTAGRLAAEHVLQISSRAGEAKETRAQSSKDPPAVCCTFTTPWRPASCARLIRRSHTAAAYKEGLAPLLSSGVPVRTEDL